MHSGSTPNLKKTKVTVSKGSVNSYSNKSANKPKITSRDEKSPNGSVHSKRIKNVNKQ